MARRLFTIAAFALIGAAINIAVAWACAVLAEAPMDIVRLGLVRARGGEIEFLWSAENAPEPADPVLDALREAWGRDYGETRLRLWSGRGSGISTSAVSGAADPRVVLIHHRCGWPYVAFACSAKVRTPRSTSNAPPIRPPASMVWRGAVSLPNAIRRRARPQQSPVGPYDRPLPCAVQWGGFLANSVGFGAAAGVLTAVPGWIRFGVRRRRRCCTGCGYPIGVSVVCTECGQPVQQIPRETAA